MDEIVSDELIEDLRDIIVEREFNVRLENVYMYWEIGERLREEEGRGFNITALVNKCSVMLQCSNRKLWNAIKIYDEHPDIKKITTGKNISVNQLLGRTQQETVEKPLSDQVISLIEKSMDKPDFKSELEIIIERIENLKKEE
jgi:hypothetical protein